MRTDLQATILGDGRIWVDPGDEEQFFSVELLANADGRFVGFDDEGHIVVRGCNGTWTYRIVSVSGPVGIYFARAMLIDSSSQGTEVTAV